MSRNHDILGIEGSKRNKIFIRKDFNYLLKSVLKGSELDLVKRYGDYRDVAEELTRDFVRNKILAEYGRFTCNTVVNVPLRYLHLLEHIEEYAGAISDYMDYVILSVIKNAELRRVKILKQIQSEIEETK